MDDVPSAGARPRRRLIAVALGLALAVVALGLAVLAARNPSPSTPQTAGSPSAGRTTPSPPTSPTPPAVSCTPGWTVAPDGGPTTDLEHRLVAVSGSSPSDLWAIGSRFENEDSNGDPLIEHWDGHSWSVAALPAATPGGELVDVAALTPDDAWAVGSHGAILHWDGRAWTVFPSPRFAPKGRSLDAIAAVSARDVWVLGSYEPVEGGESIRRDVFEHWNGSRWRVVPSPQVNPRMGTGGMQDVAANRRGDVWAVGGRARGFSEAGRLDGALVERLGPARWGRSVPPAGHNPVTLVTVSASGEVWAATGTTLRTAGEYGIGPPQRVVRWDGRRWAIAQTLSPGVSVTGIASTARRVWVVGQTGGFRRQRLFLESWNGRRWVRIPLGPAGRMGPPASEFELRTPAVTVTRDGSAVVLDTEGLPSSGQRNVIWTRCAVAGESGQS